jgi:hypothetical protein
MHIALNCYFKAIAADPARARLILIEIEGASENANRVYRAQLRASADLIRVDILKGMPENPGNGLSINLLANAFLGAVYQTAKHWESSNFKLQRSALVRNLEAMVAGIIDQWMKPPASAPSTAAKKKGSK